MKTRYQKELKASLAIILITIFIQTTLFSLEEENKESMETKEKVEVSDETLLAQNVLEGKTGNEVFEEIIPNKELSLEKEKKDELGFKKVNVYMDKSFKCYDYLRGNVKFVNWVLTKDAADVFIMVLTQNAAASIEYVLKFIPLKKNGIEEFELKFFIANTLSDDCERSDIAQYIKKGLATFYLVTPLAKYIELKYKFPEKAEELDDQWDSWVFKAELGGEFYAESLYKYYETSGSFTAQRVTELNKIILALSGAFSETIYSYEDSDETLKNSYNWLNLSNLFVWGLDDHFSLGFSSGAYRSTYKNIDYMAGLGPAIEYNVFKYADSQEKRFSFLYSVMGIYSNYIEETVYDKYWEVLYQQQLQMNLGVIKQWGNAGVTLSASNYLDEFTKYRTSFNPYVELNLGNGFSFGISGSFDYIRDQVYLAKGELTEEELLLRSSATATTWEASGSFFIAYEFGSKKNNVVNSRFE
ncbi:MAG: hypothetical protein ABIA04_13915 [Pseudomonadota bacterium]